MSTATVASRRGALITALLAALLVALLALPSVTYLLPNTDSQHPEVYQPLKTLKFFKNRGNDYHKYGPMTNFVLAPGYAVSLGYWYATGQFKNPGDQFPYGFTRPVQQMTVLIGQGRVLFLVLALGALIWLVTQTRRIVSTIPPLAIASVMLVVTSPFMIQRLPVLRPDSLLFTFTALLLCMYLRIIYIGVTRRRLVVTGILLMCAITTKEIAGAIFVLPCLGILWLIVRDTRAGLLSAGDALRGTGLAVLASVITYAALNIVYAPGVWLERMHFWLFSWNPSQIWGSGPEDGVATPLYVLTNMLGELLSHLGIGGSILTTVSIVALVVLRPRGWFLILLPVCGYLFLGLMQLGYVPGVQYFITLPILLLPPVAAGLGALATTLRHSQRSVRAGAVAIALLLAADGVHATFAWHGLDLRYNALRHNWIHQNLKPGDGFGLLLLHDFEPGRLIFETEGYRFDRRNLTGIMDADPGDRPPVLLAERGFENWLLDAKKLPARADLLQRESAIDINRFEGIPSLGYTLAHEIPVSTPSWYPYDWMRRLRWLHDKRALRVYRLDN